MAIIANSELLPQAVQALGGFVAQVPATPEQLKQWLTPQDLGLIPTDGMSKGEEVLKDTIDAACTYQLVVRQGKVLHAAVPPETLRRELRAAALRSDPEFAAAARWFLQRDAFTAGERRWDDLQRTELRTWVTNGTQWINFGRWMRHLGLARNVGGTLMPDPTRALDEELNAMINPGQELPIAEFQAKLQAQVPVLDLTGEGHFSSAVSFALEAMRRAGRLSFVNLADTQKIPLTLPGQHVFVSHVRGGAQ